MKNIICIHDAGHDPASDDELTHIGLFSLLNKQKVENVTFVGCGVNPKKSNYIAKTQTLSFLEKNNISKDDVLRDKVNFHLSRGGSGSGLVSNPPIHLNKHFNDIEKIDDIDVENVKLKINNGAIILANAPGYSYFLQNMKISGADFSESILIVQGATDPKQVSSTYNEKYGWSSLEERERYFNFFKEVYVHGREVAYRHFELSSGLLYQVGDLFKNVGYVDDPQDYVTNTLCGTQSINFVCTGPLTFSRIVNSIDLWTDEGPYALMNKNIFELASSFPENIEEDEDIFREYIHSVVTTSNDYTIISEFKHPSTEIGVMDLYNYLNNPDKDNTTLSPLAYRVMLMIYLSNGIELKLKDVDSIINYLKTKTKRIIYDPISLFIIHNILETEKMGLFNLSLNNYGEWNILEDIEIDDADKTPFSCLLELF